MSDPRPLECRFRSQEEGRGYPRSSCRACGRTITTDLGNRCYLERHPPERLYTQAEIDAAVRAERDKWRDLLGRYVQHVGDTEGTDFLDYEYPDGSLCRSEGEWLRPEDHAAIAQTAIDLCAAIRERGK